MTSQANPVSRITLLLSIATALITGAYRAAAAEAAAPVHKATLLVENRAGEQYKKQAMLLEHLLLSRAAGKGLTLLSRQVVTDAIAKEGKGANLDPLLGDALEDRSTAEGAIVRK